MQKFLVGGAVRDQLLGITSSDRDWVVVGTTPEQMLAAGFRQVGADFPVFLHPESQEEYALARTERKSGKGYTGFICDFSPQVTLEEDLRRRDLTINAMALDESGTLIDPFKGQADLQNRQLRHVSEAFVEDPLRVLRVARFAARFASSGFQVAPETLRLMQQIAESGELASLTAERIWLETSKALRESQPAIYFEVMHETRSLREVMPELDRLFEVYPNHRPHSSAAEFSLQCLTASSVAGHSVDIRFAALVHLLGMENSGAGQSTNNIETGANTIRQLCNRLKTPKSTRELATLVCRYQEPITDALTLSPEQVLTIFDGCDLWRKPARFAEILQTCEALCNAGARSFYSRTFLEAAAQSCRDLKIQPLVESGLKGLELKSRIRSRRLEIIAERRRSAPKV